MSAMHMTIEADAIHAVNDAFLIRNADGTVDEAATLVLLNELKTNLGVNYTEGTVADDIHTRFIKEKKGFGPLGQIVAIVAAVAIAIVTAGAGTGLLLMMAPAFATTAAGAVVGAALGGLITGTLSSMASQLIMTGSLNLGSALKAGMVAGVTAGLTNGALGALSEANPAVTTVGDGVVQASTEAAKTSLGDLVQQAVVRSAISAGVNTVAYGGSFGQAFVNGLATDAGAIGASAIGANLPGIGAPRSSVESVLLNAASHALLGCATQTVTGGDCAGGAIGGATSAIVAPLIRDWVYEGSTVSAYRDDRGRQAIAVALATLIGGAASAALGADITAGADAASNEALNNALSGFIPQPAPAGPQGTVTPNNGPQKTEPLTNPLEEQSRNGHAIATPNNGPLGAVLIGTPTAGPQGPTMLANPGCGSVVGVACAVATIMAAAQDGIDKLVSVVGLDSGRDVGTSAIVNEFESSEAALPLGSRYNQMNQPTNPPYQPVRNSAAAVDGIEYSGHALDRMQDRGLTPTVVKNAVNNGVPTPSRGGTTVYYDSSNNVSVVTSREGKVITVKYGK